MKRRITLVAAVLVLFSPGLVSAQDMPAGDEEPDLRLDLSCPRERITAGENVVFKLTLRNLSNEDLEVSPLQPVVFLGLRVVSAGEEVAPQVKVLAAPWASVALAAGKVLEADVDVCSWFPLSLHSGSFQLSFSYYPIAGNRNVVVQSNVIHLEVSPRTDDQGKAFKDFVAILRATGDEAVERGEQFLAQHKGSMFDARVRLELARRYLTRKEYEKVREVLGGEFTRSSPTSVETALRCDLTARSLRAQGRLADAISELEKTDAPWAASEVERWRLELQLRQD